MKYAIGKDSHFERVEGQVYRYLGGCKRCNICEIFLKTDGNSCPCCGSKLRQNPRDTKYKQKLRLIRNNTRTINT